LLFLLLFLLLGLLLVLLLIVAAADDGGHHAQHHQEPEQLLQHGCPSFRVILFGEVVAPQRRLYTTDAPPPTIFPEIRHRPQVVALPPLPPSFGPRAGAPATSFLRPLVPPAPPG